MHSITALADSPPITLFLDECIPRYTFEVTLLPLLASSEARPVMVHATDAGMSNLADDAIADRAAAEGWLVVSKDNGRSSRGPKLPLVFAERRLTHVLFSRKLAGADSTALARAFSATWDDLLVSIADSSPRRLTICRGNRHGYRLAAREL